MISEVIIPDLGATGGDVTLEEWLVKPGQAVKNGQPLFIVTTDKATVEVEAYRDGVLREILAQAGQVLATSSVVALIADSAEEEIEQPEAAAATIPAAASQKLEPNMYNRTPPSQQRILASPLARRMASQEGIDLRLVNGSGTQGQILKRDILAVITAMKSGTTQRPEQGIQRTALSPMQRAIAERVQRSKDQIPHFYASITIDMSAALEARQQAVQWAAEQDWSKPSLTDLCIKAAALTLREVPTLNASYDGDAILTYSEINIGLVIGLEQGLLVPVIPHADQLDLFTLAATTQRLRRQAEAGQLSASDLSGGTFTLSNLGMYGLDSFTAVINPPQAGILALGAVKEQPVVIDGELAVRPLMTAALSVDHRVVDGITAARFADAYKVMLENPLRLTLDPRQESSP
jgi:pyruvate dehydrogenase E2 component (dihydrolipoamide acetyltransferase)